MGNALIFCQILSTNFVWKFKEIGMENLYVDTRAFLKTQLPTTANIITHPAASTGTLITNFIKGFAL